MWEPHATVTAFYESFAERDHEAMGALYSGKIEFADPVFGDLVGRKANAMWHMLCEQGTDLQIAHAVQAAEADVVSATWEATYTFTPTGRKVHNMVDASFVVRDGLIVRHVDTFSLWRWTRMALGVTGTLGGWTPLVRNRVRTTALRGLERFIAQHPEYAA